MIYAAETLGLDKRELLRQAFRIPPDCRNFTTM